MNILQLSEIIKTTDKKQIKAELKRLGYIDCAKDKKMRHINMCDIANADEPLSTEEYPTKNGKYEFYGDICKNVVGFKDVEFIVVTINKVYKKKDLSFPYRVYVFAKEANL